MKREEVSTATSYLAFLTETGVDKNGTLVFTGFLKGVSGTSSVDLTEQKKMNQ